MKKIIVILSISISMIAFQHCSVASFSTSGEDGSTNSALTDCGDCDLGGLSEIVIDPGDGGFPNTGGAPQEECAKVESLSIDQEIYINEKIIVISELQIKEGQGSNEDVVGFTIDSNSDMVSFLVKSGNEGFTGEGLSWVNPNGTRGSAAKAISHVIFCIGLAPEEIMDSSLD